MPAVTETSTAIDWPKANIDAPDALHQMALAHFDVNTEVLTVYDMRGTLKASYQVADHNLAGEQFTGTVTGGSSGDGPVTVRPAHGCSCNGYRRTRK